MTEQTTAEQTTSEQNENTHSSQQKSGPDIGAWTKEVEVMGNEVVDRIKELIQSGNARKVIVRKPDGEKLFDVPLTAGAVVGGLVTLAAPWLAIIGALGGALAKVKIEVEYNENPSASNIEPPQEINIERDI